VEFTDKEKEDFKWLLNKYEQCNNRYNEAEDFIMSILDMKWYQRIFLSNKVFKFMKGICKKYDF
jgi:hypothetical protein